MLTQLPLASLLREGFEEITYYGELVAVRPDGSLWRAGEGEGRYPARSLLKPFQFLACDLPDDRWKSSGLENSRYAPCVGSISGTMEQMRVMDAWYRKGKPKAVAEKVRVPPGLPLDPEKRLQAKALGPKPLYHFCFSKHAAIVEACEYHGWDTDTYLSPEHPFHGRLLTTLSELLGKDLTGVTTVTDGCHLPTPVLALSDMAGLYGRLAAAPETSSLGWVRRLMFANPHWVGGPERTDTLLMQANPGRVVAKEGADGLLGLGIVPDGLGIVVKLASGFEMRSAALILAPLLEALDLNPVHAVPAGQTVRHHYRPFGRGASPFVDISPKVSPRTAVWPGDVPFSRSVSLDTSAGHHLTLSSITTTVHVGAHTDAPNHFDTNKGIDAVEVDRYAGLCQVVTVGKERGTTLSPADLKGVGIRAERVLFRTSSFPDPDRFNEDFVALSGELVEWLAARGVRLVGLDTPSVDTYSSKELPAHKATLRTGMAVLEGIVLEGVEDGIYELTALPLPLEGADASPVRAVLRKPRVPDR